MRDRSVQIAIPEISFVAHGNVRHFCNGRTIRFYKTNIATLSPQPFRPIAPIGRSLSTRFYASTPVNSPEANIPNFTLPEMLSPSLIPLNLSFIGIGRSIFVVQDNRFPSDTTSSIGPVPFLPVISPCQTPSTSETAMVALVLPVGASITIAHFSNISPSSY